MFDQKFKLQTSISSIKNKNGLYDIESYAVHGILIVGLMPSDPDQLESFELFRANSISLQPSIERFFVPLDLNLSLFGRKHIGLFAGVFGEWFGDFASTQSADR